jgi:hypothetical protein
MEQPYVDVAIKFNGRGPSAPAEYAKTGKRPQLPSEDDVSPAVVALIGACWHADPKQRPRFADVVTMFATNKSLVFKDQFDEDNAPVLPASTRHSLEEVLT